jgi:hypothetical protein
MHLPFRDENSEYQTIQHPFGTHEQQELSSKQNRKAMTALETQANLISYFYGSFLLLVRLLIQQPVGFAGGEGHSLTGGGFKAG